MIPSRPDPGAALTSLEMSIYLDLHKSEFSAVKDFVSKGLKKRSVEHALTCLVKRGLVFRPKRGRYAPSASESANIAEVSANIAVTHPHLNLESESSTVTLDAAPKTSQFSFIEEKDYQISTPNGDAIACIRQFSSAQFKDLEVRRKHLFEVFPYSGLYLELVDRIAVMRFTLNYDYTEAMLGHWKWFCDNDKKPFARLYKIVEALYNREGFDFPPCQNDELEYIILLTAKCHSNGKTCQ